MSTILEEFKNRIDFIEGLHYEDASSRISDLINWFEVTPEIKSIIDQIKKDNYLDEYLKKRHS